MGTLGLPLRVHGTYAGIGMARYMSLGSEDVASRSLKREDKEDIDDREREKGCLGHCHPFHCGSIASPCQTKTVRKMGRQLEAVEW